MLQKPVWSGLLALVCVVLLACTSAEAAVKSFKLQRRLGTDGEWDTIANFSLKQLSPHSPVQLRHSQTGKDSVLLSEAEKEALTSKNLVYYRALAQSSEAAAKDAKDSVVVAVSPCTIIRGFLAQDSSTVVLYERLNVVPGPDGTILGLQVVSETNLFHAKLLNGDECDLHVVQKLFPKVRIQLELGIVHPVQVLNKVRYEDLEEIRTPSKNGKNKPKTAIKRVKNADGEWEEQEVVVEEQTFFQKYWLYIVIFFGVSIMRSMSS